MHFILSLVVTSKIFLLFSLFADLNCSSSVGTKPILLSLFPRGIKSCSCSQDSGENSGKSSVYWVSVFKAAANKNPYGKICLHVETVHTAKEGFPKIFMIFIGIPVLQSLLGFNANTWKFLSLKLISEGRMWSHIMHHSQKWNQENVDFPSCHLSWRAVLVM